MPTQRTKGVPAPVAPMDAERSEIVHDALDMRHKSADTAIDDLQEAFNQIPKEQLEHAAAVCRDLGNEAVRAGRHEEAQKRKCGFQRVRRGRLSSYHQSTSTSGYRERSGGGPL